MESRTIFRLNAIYRHVVNKTPVSQIKRNDAVILETGTFEDNTGDLMKFIQYNLSAQMSLDENSVMYIPMRTPLITVTVLPDNNYKVEFFPLPALKFFRVSMEPRFIYACGLPKVMTERLVVCRTERYRKALYALYFMFQRKRIQIDILGNYILIGDFQDLMCQLGTGLAVTLATLGFGICTPANDPTAILFLYPGTTRVIGNYNALLDGRKSLMFMYKEPEMDKSLDEQLAKEISSTYVDRTLNFMSSAFRDICTVSKAISQNVDIPAPAEAESETETETDQDQGQGQSLPVNSSMSEPISENEVVSTPTREEYRRSRSRSRSRSPYRRRRSRSRSPCTRAGSYQRYRGYPGPGPGPTLGPVPIPVPVSGPVSGAGPTYRRYPGPGPGHGPGPGPGPRPFMPVPQAMPFMPPFNPYFYGYPGVGPMPGAYPGYHGHF